MRDERGASLIEVGLAAALSLIIVGGLSGALYAALRTSSFGSTQSEALDASRLVLNQVQRDLQGSQGYADCSSGAGTCVQLTVQSPSGVQQKIRYRHVSGTLYREVDDGTGTYPGSRTVSTRLANTASSPVFRCTILGHLLQIGVHLVVRPDASRPSTFNLQTVVRPRNTYAAIC